MMIATDEIHDHEARCQRHLLTLAMLARNGDDQPPTAAEVGRVTGAIFTEAEASARAALAAAAPAHPGTWTLLLARLNRLAAAASETVTAARDGDAAALRRHVRRLETVTSAIWTVQHAVCDPAPPARATRSAPDDVVRRAPADPPGAGPQHAPRPREEQ